MTYNRHIEDNNETRWKKIKQHPKGDSLVSAAGAERRSSSRWSFGPIIHHGRPFRRETGAGRVRPLSIDGNGNNNILCCDRSRPGAFPRGAIVIGARPPAAVGKMRLWRRRLESMNGHTRSPNIARRQTKSRCYHAACVKINNNVGSVLVRWFVAIRLTSSGGISCFSRSAAKSAREGRSRRRRLHAIPIPLPPHPGSKTESRFEKRFGTARRSEISKI